MVGGGQRFNLSAQSALAEPGLATEYMAGGCTKKDIQAKEQLSKSRKRKSKEKTKDKRKTPPKDSLMQSSPFTTLPLPEVAASPFPSAASRLPLPDPAAAADAIRIKGGHGKNGKPGVKTVDVGIAQGNHEHGESPAWSQGLDGRQRKAPPTMAATLGRFLQRLATTTGKLRLQARGIRASIPKAKKDMETAHVLVQTLKARAAGKTVPTPAEQVIPVDAVEDMSFIEDPEERSLRQKPHGLLA